MPLPDWDIQPRVPHDIDDLLDFIRRQSWGNAHARRRDIGRAIHEILKGPELNNIGVRRRFSGIELRRHNAAQFVVIYAYRYPSSQYPNGLVSIRAIRHNQLKNVFRGVKEGPIRPYGYIDFLPDVRRVPLVSVPVPDADIF